MTPEPPNGATLTDQAIANGKPATAAAFRAQAAAPAYLLLPESRLTVQVKRAHISDLAAAGQIPNELLGIVARVLGLPGASPRPDTLEESARESRAVIDAVCCAVLVEPRMVPEGADPDGAGGDAVWPSDVPWADREHIFQYAARLGEVRPLARFPVGQAGDLAPLAHESGLGDEA